MDVNLGLIILCIDLKQSTPQILLEDGQIPTQKLDGHPLLFCEQICKDFLEIDTKWIDFILVDVKYDDDLTLYYTCMIPKIIKTKKGEWESIGAVHENFQKLVFEAGQRAISRRPTGI